MNDWQTAEAFMRGEAIDAAGEAVLPVRKDQTGLHLRVNGRGLDAAADVGALPDMLAEWRAFLEGVPEREQRPFAKRFIVHAVGANRHLDPDIGSMAMGAALWMASDNREVMSALSAGGSALLCEIALNHETGDLRTQLSLLME
jgi:hypothetical protein